MSWKLPEGLEALRLVWLWHPRSFPRETLTSFTSLHASFRKLVCERRRLTFKHFWGSKPSGGLTCQTAKNPFLTPHFFSFFLPRFEDGTPGYAFKMFWKPKPSEWIYKFGVCSINLISSSPSSPRNYPSSSSVQEEEDVNHGCCCLFFSSPSSSPPLVPLSLFFQRCVVVGSAYVITDGR